MKLRRNLTFLAVVLALAFCFAQTARAQITQDNITTINSTFSTSSLNWSHSVAGSNRILIVGVSYRDGNITTTNVTFAGTNLTRIGFRAGTGNDNRAELWYMIAPPTGSSPVTVTVSPAKQVAACAISFTGVNQTTPLNTFASAAGQSLTPSVNVPSAAGELVVDALSANSEGLYVNANAGQTQRWTLQTGVGLFDVRSGGSTKPGAGPSVNMGWTMGVLTTWSIVAVSLKPVPAVPPNVALVKSVTPSGNQLPGTDLTYTVNFTSNGGAAVSNLVITDAIPANTDFKVNSETHSLGTTGLTVTVNYSNDNGATWTYIPVSGGGSAPPGYDRKVTTTRWAFSGLLVQTSPNNTGSVSFTTRIR